jgi:serine protease Do
MWLTLTGDDGERLVEVKGDEFVIGRDDEADLVVDDPKVSRRHASLQALPDGRAELNDLQTTNGTFVDERRIEGPVTLEGGETVRVGRTKLKTSKQAPGAPAGTGSPTVIGDSEAQATAEAQAPAAAAADAAPARPSVIQRSRSVIERIQLRREVRILTVVAGAAVVLAAAAVVLLVTGVFSGKENPSPDEIVKAVSPSTVLVYANRGDRGGGTGTGWVLDARSGLIVTNGHVVNEGTTFQVGVGEQKRDAKLVGDAPCEDLAVLKVDNTSGLQTLALARSQSTIKLGERVVAVGFPGTASEKQALTATTGVVSQVKTDFSLREIRARFSVPAFDVPAYSNVILTDTTINHGNSGGPLVDFDKRLVGVNSAGGLPETQNQNYAIGIDRVKEIVPQLRAGKSLAWMGFGFDFTATAKAAGADQVAPGIVVTHSVPGSPAERAGFTDPTGILVKNINGKDLDGTLDSYCKAVGTPNGTGGDRMRVTLQTSPTAAPQTINVPLG